MPPFNKPWLCPKGYLAQIVADLTAQYPNSQHPEHGNVTGNTAYLAVYNNDYNQIQPGDGTMAVLVAQFDQVSGQPLYFYEAAFSNPLLPKHPTQPPFYWWAWRIRVTGNPPPSGESLNTILNHTNWPTNDIGLLVLDSPTTNAFDSEPSAEIWWDTGTCDPDDWRNGTKRLSRLSVAKDSFQDKTGADPINTWISTPGVGKYKIIRPRRRLCLPNPPWPNSPRPKFKDPKSK